jgi:hypothetical protein
VKKFKRRKTVELIDFCVVLVVVVLGVVLVVIVTVVVVVLIAVPVLPHADPEIPALGLPKDVSETRTADDPGFVTIGPPLSPCLDTIKK